MKRRQKSAYAFSHNMTRVVEQFQLSRLKNVLTRLRLLRAGENGFVFCFVVLAYYSMDFPVVKYFLLKFLMFFCDTLNK